MSQYQYKIICAFFITVSVKKLLHYRAGGLLQYRAFLLHYRALITLSGVFITLSGTYYSIGRLLHYRLVQSRSTIPLTAILFEFLYPWIMFPNIGRIPDMIICPALACFVIFSRCLYFSTIAFVPSSNVLFVPTCTSMVPPFPLHMIFSTLSPSVICSILAPGKHTTMSSPLLNLVSVILTIESPT